MLHVQPRAVVSRAIPVRRDVGAGGHKGPAFVKPPASALSHRTMASICVVVLVQRRKFHPVVRHHQTRFNEVQQIVDATGSTTHNIADDILALGLNNNRQCCNKYSFPSI